MVVILYRLWLYLLGLLRGSPLALALCRYYVYALGLFLVWGSGVGIKFLSSVHYVHFFAEAFGSTR